MNAYIFSLAATALTNINEISGICFAFLLICPKTVQCNIINSGSHQISNHFGEIIAIVNALVGVAILQSGEMPVQRMKVGYAVCPSVL